MRPPRVLPITPGAAGLDGGEQLKVDLARLREGGGRGVLLREPQLSDLALLELAMFARDLFRDGWLGVHDRPHIAIACRADAVHLGFRSLSSAAARQVVGDQLQLGRSHHHEELSRDEMEADYRLMGPVHFTPSKEGLLEPIGLEAMSEVGMPKQTWAVGGVGPEQAPRLLSLGLGGVACIGSVFGVGDAAQGISEMLEAAE